MSSRTRSLRVSRCVKAVAWMRALKPTSSIPPVEQLPLHYVQDWYFAAYDPKGIAKETWGYLLPRILEILAVDEDVSYVAKEVSLNRFDTGNPEKWSDDEWKVLNQFQRVFLQREIERQRDCLDDTICMFGLAGWPLQDLLDQVASNPDDKLAQRFWNDWCKNRVPGRESVWITAFWEDSGRKTVFDFYTSQKMRDRMEALVLADNTEAALAEKASAVVSVIEASASWRSSSNAFK